MPTLTQVDAYHIPEILIDRIIVHRGFPRDFVVGLFHEAKRLLYLASISDRDIVPSARVDIAWHELLMDTKWYRDFSGFLGVFIHHVPFPPDDEPHEETWDDIQHHRIIPSGSDDYLGSLREYEKRLGITPQKLFWPS